MPNVEHLSMCKLNNKTNKKYLVKGSNGKLYINSDNNGKSRNFVKIGVESYIGISIFIFLLQVKRKKVLYYPLRLTNRTPKRIIKPYNIRFVQQDVRVSITIFVTGCFGVRGCLRSNVKIRNLKTWTLSYVSIIFLVFGDGNLGALLYFVTILYITY